VFTPSVGAVESRRKLDFCALLEAACLWRIALYLLPRNQHKMGEQELNDLSRQHGVAPWRMQIARRVESPMVQRIIVALILINAVVLGLETSPEIMSRAGGLLIAIDRFCLLFFSRSW